MFVQYISFDFNILLIIFIHINFTIFSTGLEIDKIIYHITAFINTVFL